MDKISIYTSDTVEKPEFIPEVTSALTLETIAESEVQNTEVPSLKPFKNLSNLSTIAWFSEGIRAGFFLKPRVRGFEPMPWQLVLILLLTTSLHLVLEWAQMRVPAIFEAQAWASNWWLTLIFIGLAWWAFPLEGSQVGEISSVSTPSRGIAAAVVVVAIAVLPASVVYQSLQIAIAHEWLKPSSSVSAWAYWLAYGIFAIWSLGVELLVLLRFSGRTWRGAVASFILIAATVLTISQFNMRSIQEDYSQRSAEVEEKPRLRLTQQTFEEQQALWQKTFATIAPQRPGVADVYALVFAPYASEDVFKRESTMVSTVLSERFDAGGRVVQLLNHGATSKTHLWATTLSLQRAIEALAQRMDRENDILVVYLTSHGGKDFKLAASHWPLEVAPLTPQELKLALDTAGIKNRVLAISACYSGGWADVLATDNTLVMTASDATHTSYGCGNRSELTFFGRALFDEQLRDSFSFEQAFNKAVPIIKQREIDADKEDGFSNPQISVGANIRPVLKELEMRLLNKNANTAPTKAQ